MLKIAISGKAGSGKNTVASLIATDILKLKKHEYHISAFAAKIKEITELFFPNCDKEALYGPSELRQNVIVSDLSEEIDIGVTYRDVTLDIGKLGRKYNPQFWVGHIAAEHRKLHGEIKLYAIPDMRFKEEHTWLRKNGFTLCRVKRDNLIKVNDISETEQDGMSDDIFDFVIENNCSLEDLRAKVTVALDKHYSNNKAYLQVRNATI
jgi:hypothetical protein